MSKLEKFKEQMQIELDANVHKGNWEDFLNPGDILKELRYHQSKMINAMYDEDKKLIKDILLIVPTS